MIRLLAYTGLRRSEPVMLRWSDVDAEAGLVMFRHGCAMRKLQTLAGTARKSNYRLPEI